MIWFIIIIGVVGYVLWQFNSDTKRVKGRNLSLGGMKKLFPEFVEYFETSGFEFVEDSGTNLIYKKALTKNPVRNKYLFLGLESKFGNIAYGYIITEDGNEIYGLNVELSKVITPDDVEMTIRKITGQLRLQGHL